MVSAALVQYVYIHIKELYKWNIDILYETNYFIISHCMHHSENVIFIYTKPYSSHWARVWLTPIFQPVLQVFFSGMVRLRSLVTSDGPSTQSRLDNLCYISFLELYYCISVIFSQLMYICKTLIKIGTSLEAW